MKKDKKNTPPLMLKEEDEFRAFIPRPKQPVRQAGIEDKIEILRKNKISCKNKFFLCEKSVRGGTSVSELKYLMSQIFIHLNLPIYMIEKAMFIKPLNIDADAPFIPARIHGDEMTFYLHDLNNIYHYAAMIVHESVHYYLGVERKIICENEDDNELLVDTAAVFLGFGNIYYNAYLAEVSPIGENKVLARKFGSINTDEVEAIEKIMADIKGENITVFVPNYQNARVCRDCGLFTPAGSAFCKHCGIEDVEIL